MVQITVGNLERSVRKQARKTTGYQLLHCALEGGTSSYRSRGQLVLGPD